MTKNEARLSMVLGFKVRWYKWVNKDMYCYIDPQGDICLRHNTTSLNYNYVFINIQSFKDGWEIYND